MHNAAAELSLVWAQTDESVSDSDAEEINGLLSYLIRANDLIFRAGRGRWLIALPVPESEIARFHHAWARQSKSKP